MRHAAARPLSLKRSRARTRAARTFRKSAAAAASPFAARSSKSRSGSMGTARSLRRRGQIFGLSSMVSTRSDPLDE